MEGHSAWKRNKKVAIRPLLQVLTVPHLDFCSPTHHAPSWLGFVRHDEPLPGSIAFFSCVCVAHESGHPYGIPPLGWSTFCWSAPVRHHGQSLNELVASFQESRRGTPWPWWRASTADEGVAVRKIRGTLWQRVRRNGHDHCQFYSCTPEVYWPPLHAFSHNISIGWTGEQNLQPVNCENRQ